MRVTLFVISIMITQALGATVSAQGNTVNAPLGFPPGVKFPHPVGIIGDVDRDGVDDFAVGSHFDSTFNNSSGAVFALSGRTGAVIWSDYGTTLTEQMGYAVAAIPDYDGDGFDEIAVGVPRATGPTVNLNLPPGYVRIYHGATGTVLAQWTDPATPGGYGSSIVRISDLNGDGIDEIAVGKPALIYPFLLTPGIDIYSGATLSLIQSFSPPFLLPGSTFGSAMVGGEDINGDSVPDLVVAAPWWFYGGAVLALSGSDLSLLWTSATGAPPGSPGCGCERLGEQIDFLVDFDGDGVRDLFASLFNMASLRQARIISGATGATITTFIGSGFGCVGLSVVPDQNGDGLPDLLSINVSSGLNFYAAPSLTLIGTVPCQIVQPQPCALWVAVVSDRIDLDRNGVDEWIMFRAVNGAGTYEVSTFGPALAVPAASGAFAPSGSVPYQPLRVNGSTGGFTRRVAIPAFEPITIAVLNEPAASANAPFVLWGTFGTPTVNDTVTGPLGSLCFFPASAAPGVPWLFTIANSLFPDPTAILGATAAPWSLSIPSGVPYPLDFTIQGLMLDTTGQPRVTNAVLVSVY